MNIPSYVSHAEQRILGSLIASPDIAVPAVLEHLDPEDFSEKKGQVLYAAIASLVEEGTKPERSIVSARLRRNEELELVGGAEYIAEIALPGESPAAVAEYCDIVRDFALRNRLQESGHKIASMATDRDVGAEELLDQSVQLLAAAGGKAGSTGVMDIRQATDQWRREANDVRVGHGGITTGYAVLDARVRGLQGNVVVIAALPGLGKTCFGLNMVWNQATAGIPVAIISLEMTANAVAERLMQIEGRCTSEDLERDPAFADRLSDQLEKKPIRIAAMGSSSAGGILRQMRILEQQGVRSFFVDYLQLITDKKAERRDLEVSNPLRMFIQFVKRSNLSVITASQANRSAVTEGEGGVPKMWQMKESSGIEAHADIIWGLGSRSYTNPSDINAPLYLEILKSRQRGFVGMRIPFEFDRSRQLIQASVQVF